MDLKLDQQSTGENKPKETEKDLIIVGAGAGGLAAAQYGARANLRTLVIEELASGGQALNIDGLENYPGFPEPVNGFELSQQLEQQAKNFGAEILMGTATEITKKGNTFTVKTTMGDYTAPTVIAATGSKHRLLGIPGEKEFSGRGVSYCATCDGPFFKNKKMLVVGGGDAACDESMFLSKLSDKVVLVHRRDRFRAQKSLADRVLHNENIETRFNTVPVEIRGENKVEKVLLKNSETGEEYEEAFDAVFVFIGSIPQNQLFPDTEKDEVGHILTNQRMETNVPGMYAVGDLRSTPFRQLVVAAGEGAIAAHSASQYIDDLEGQAYE
ncbi:MAG: thioredoxin-disulfide reductase [Spirochaetales bacterium]|nr:thioredoxin-disulfide reductase [Spirochaetales bacterium]MCF7937576.1 thioredoxin-disulfide reductase [Spirochaetales bacterium]